MGNYKPIDLAKEDFRKYLDRQGVLEAITSVLLKCNSERPENALDFVHDNMMEKCVPLKSQLQNAQDEIERLKAELRALKASDGAIKQDPPEGGKSATAKQENKIDTPSPAQTNGGGVEVGAAAAGGETKENDAIATSAGKETGNTTNGTSKDNPGKDIAEKAGAPLGSEAPEAKNESNPTTPPTVTETK